MSGYGKKDYGYEYEEYDCCPERKKEKKAVTGCTFGDICQVNKAWVKQFAKIEQEVEQENTFVAICEAKGKKKATPC